MQSVPQDRILTGERVSGVLIRWSTTYDRCRWKLSRSLVYQIKGDFFFFLGRMWHGSMTLFDIVAGVDEIKKKGNWKRIDSRMKWKKWIDSCDDTRVSIWNRRKRMDDRAVVAMSCSRTNWLECVGANE